MENESYNYNERDGWSDELIAAHWRMRYAVIYYDILKTKATETGLLTDPVMADKIANAERQMQKTALIYKTTYERWKNNVWLS